MAKLFALAALAAAATAFTTIPEHSFSPPFSTFDSDGMRTIPNFRVGGHATINENFLRLTNDRQSKRSSAWNTAKLDRDEWSTTIRFRVSGQGRKLFGDGFALWFTAHAAHRDGSLHGFTDTFKGFGVIFDTWVNTDPGHVHRDVQVVASDGSGPKDLKDPNPIGCDADFRYWEGRDDFTVTNHSAARIRFAGNRLWVHIDPRADGSWKTCVSEYALPIPEGWHREGAWLGLTATTGDLADNHDILSFDTGPEDEVAPSPFDAGATGGYNGFQSTGNPQLDDAVKSAVASSVSTVEERLSYIHHHMEHTVTALEDSIKSALKKVSDAEAANTKRIEELERRLADKLTDKLTDRVAGQVAATVEGKVDSSISSRLEKLEGALNDKVATKLQDVRSSIDAQVEQGKSSWVLPFIGIALLLAIIAVKNHCDTRSVKRSLKGSGFLPGASTKLY